MCVCVCVVRVCVQQDKQLKEVIEKGQEMEEVSSFDAFMMNNNVLSVWI